MVKNTYIKPVLITHMKLTAFHSEFNIEAVCEVKIWRLVESDQYPFGLKYSLFCVDVNSKKTLIGYDNHYPKGPHRFCVMKLKKAVIKIRSLKDVKSEMRRAFKGEYTGIQKKNEIVFFNFEAASKVFSKNRMQILQTIARDNPRSIYDLAKILEKDFKSVHTDVKYLSSIGLIELQETDDSRNGLKPIALYSGIEFDWAA